MSHDAARLGAEPLPGALVLLLSLSLPQAASNGSEAANNENTREYRPMRGFYLSRTIRSTWRIRFSQRKSPTLFAGRVTLLRVAMPSAFWTMSSPTFTRRSLVAVVCRVS